MRFPGIPRHLLGLLYGQLLIFLEAGALEAASYEILDNYTCVREFCTLSSANLIGLFE